MEAGHFDRLSRTVGAAGTRRSAFAGLVAGTVALAGRGLDSEAAKRKKKKEKEKDKEQCPTCPECTYCPQRTCCACRAEKLGPPVACFTVEGWSLAEARQRCIVACGGNEDLLYVAEGPIVGAVSSCTADATCHLGPCPIPVNA